MNKFYRATGKVKDQGEKRNKKFKWEVEGGAGMLLKYHDQRLKGSSPQTNHQGVQADILQAQVLPHRYQHPSNSTS